MERALTIGKVTRRQSNDFAVDEMLADDSNRVRISWLAKLGNDHFSVGDIEIAVAGWKPLSMKPDGFW